MPDTDNNIRKLYGVKMYADQINCLRDIFADPKIKREHHTMGNLIAASVERTYNETKAQLEF
jgi:hypothetical protein